MEIRGDFQINQKKYSVFIIRRNRKVEGFLFERSDKDRFMNPVPIKISTSTRKEAIEYWLMRLQRYLTEHRRKQHGQAGSSVPGKRPGSNV